MRRIVSASACGLVGIEAGGGLVEQQQPRLRGERARDLEQALLAVGQRVGAHVGLRGEAHEGEQLARLGADALFLLAHPARTQQRGADRASGDQMEADLHVLVDGQVLEQLHQLIGAHQPARGDLALRQAGDVGARQTRCGPRSAGRSPRWR